MSSEENKSDVVTFIVCVCLTVLTLIASITFYNYNESQNISKNIEAAINKGIDPLAVKCAYEDYSSNACVAYSIKGLK
jgi:hypothetical protein